MQKLNKLAEAKPILIIKKTYFKKI